MSDPYAWFPNCLCSHPAYNHDLVKAGGQRLRTTCSAPLCGCSLYRSPAVPRGEQRHCATCRCGEAA